MSAALQVVLADGEGTVIDANEGKYILEPVGLKKMTGFSNGYPNTTAEPVAAGVQYPAISPSSVNGNYLPATYSSSVEGTTEWQIFEVTYCEYGFIDDTPIGPFFVWNVSYDGDLMLEAGKLYTFTVKLPDPQVITKGSASEVSADVTSMQVIDFTSVR